MITYKIICNNSYFRLRGNTPPPTPSEKTAHFHIMSSFRKRIYCIWGRWYIVKTTARLDPGGDVLQIQNLVEKTPETRSRETEPGERIVIVRVIIDNNGYVDLPHECKR
jgi:hypothetical protein